VYVCAYPDAPASVTEEPGSVEVRPEAVQRLEDVARKLSSEMRDPSLAPVALHETTKEKGQSCHLPVTRDGAPIMGKVPNTKNVYVATGHSCWGILNAPASGAAMAELIADGKVTVVPGFERFAPRRAT
jgi:glycine/D-amino acid oxidase-like deaminating enzyme